MKNFFITLTLSLAAVCMIACENEPTVEASKKENIKIELEDYNSGINVLLITDTKTDKEIIVIQKGDNFKLIDRSTGKLLEREGHENEEYRQNAAVE